MAPNSALVSKFIHVFNAVLDEEGLLESLELELAHAAIQLFEHGLENRILFGVGARGLGGGGQGGAQQRRADQQGE